MATFFIKRLHPSSVALTWELKDRDGKVILTPHPDHHSFETEKAVREDIAAVKKYVRKFNPVIVKTL